MNHGLKDLLSKLAACAVLLTAALGGAATPAWSTVSEFGESPGECQEEAEQEQAVCRDACRRNAPKTGRVLCTCPHADIRAANSKLVGLGATSGHRLSNGLIAPIRT